MDVLQGSGGSPSLGRELDVRLDRAFEDALRERRIVGGVAIVACDGDVVYRRAHGFADRESRRLMRTSTRFRLASITKPIVTLAALRLVAQGTLQLESPVTRWLPDFLPRAQDGSTPGITIHQLLTHTAGLRYGFRQAAGSLYHQLGISDGLDLVGFDLAENLRRLVQAPLFYSPGAGWDYSLGLDVLGAALEVGGGKSLAALVDEAVVRPLGLRATGFVAPDDADFAAPYANGEQEPVRMTDNCIVPLPEGRVGAVRFAPSRVFNPGAFPSGGAGMYGCADDVMQVLETIRCADKFLPLELVAAMHTDHTRPGADTRGPGWGFGYGGALLVDPRRAGSPQSTGTMQWGGVYGHTWFVDRARGLSVLLLTNTAYEGMSGRLALQVRDAVYGESSA